MFKRLLLKLKLNSITKAKKKEIINRNFESAANLRDQEKALMKQIKMLKSR